MRSLRACFNYRRQAFATEPLQPHGDAEQGGSSEDGRDAEVAGIAPPTSGTTHHKHPFSRARLRWSTAVFTFIASLLFADQNLLSPNVRQGVALAAPCITLHAAPMQAARAQQRRRVLT